MHFSKPTLHTSILCSSSPNVDVVMTARLIRHILATKNDTYSSSHEESQSTEKSDDSTKDTLRSENGGNDSIHSRMPLENWSGVHSTSDPNSLESIQRVLLRLQRARAVRAGTLSLEEAVGLDEADGFESMKELTTFTDVDTLQRNGKEDRSNGSTSLGQITNSKGRRLFKKNNQTPLLDLESNNGKKEALEEEKKRYISKNLPLCEWVEVPAPSSSNEGHSLPFGMPSTIPLLFVYELAAQEELLASLPQEDGNRRGSTSHSHKSEEKPPQSGAAVSHPGGTLVMNDLQKAFWETIKPVLKPGVMEVAVVWAVTDPRLLAVFHASKYFYSHPTVEKHGAAGKDIGLKAKERSEKRQLNLHSHPPSGMASRVPGGKGVGGQLETNEDDVKEQLFIEVRTILLRIIIYINDSAFEDQKTAILFPDGEEKEQGAVRALFKQHGVPFSHPQRSGISRNANSASGSFRGRSANRRNSHTSSAGITNQALPRGRHSSKIADGGSGATAALFNTATSRLCDVRNINFFAPPVSSLDEILYDTSLLTSPTPGAAAAASMALFVAKQRWFLAQESFLLKQRAESYVFVTPSCEEAPSPPSSTLNPSLSLLFPVDEAEATPCLKRHLLRPWTSWSPMEAWLGGVPTLSQFYSLRYGLEEERGVPAPPPSSADVTGGPHRTRRAQAHGPRFDLTGLGPLTEGPQAGLERSLAVPLRGPGVSRTPPAPVWHITDVVQGELGGPEWAAQCRRLVLPRLLELGALVADYEAWRASRLVTPLPHQPGPHSRSHNGGGEAEVRWWTCTPSEVVRRGVASTGLLKGVYTYTDELSSQEPEAKGPPQGRLKALRWTLSDQLLYQRDSKAYGHFTTISAVRALISQVASCIAHELPMALVKPITLPPSPPSHPSITEKPQSGNVLSESLTEEVRHGTGILKNEHEVGKTEIMVPPPLAVVLQPQRTLARGDGKKKGSHEEAEILFDELAVNGETSSHEPPISKSHVSLFRTYNSAMYKGDDLDPLVKAADVAAPISTHWVSRQRQLQLVESMRAQSSQSVLRNHVSRSPTPVNTGKRISHAPSLGRLGSQAQTKPEKVETKLKSVAESLLCAVPIDHVFKSPTPALLPNEVKQLVAQSIKTALGSALRESNSSSDMLTHLSDIEVAETRFIERFVAKMAKAFPTACEPNASGCNNEPIKYTHAGTAKTTAMNRMDKGTMRNIEEQLLISYLLKNHISKLFPAQKRQLQNAEIRSVSMRERDHITQEALFHIVAREVGVFPYQPMTSTELPRISTTSTEFAVNGKYAEHHRETEAYGLEETVELRTAFSRMLAFCLRYGLHNTAIHTLDCTALVGVDGELVGGVKATNCRGSLNNASPAVESGQAKTLWVIGVRTPPTRCRRLLWLYPYRNGTYSLEEYISSKQWLNRTVNDASRALSGTSDPHSGEDSGKMQQLAIGLVGQVLSGKGPSCPSGDARPSPSKNSPLYDLLRAHLQNRYVNMPLIVMPGPTLSSITSLSPSDGPPSCAYSAGMTWGGSLPISAQVLHDMLFEGKHTVFPYENSLVEVTTTSTRRICQYIAQHELIVSLHCDYTRLEDPRNVEGGFPSTARPQVFLVARFDDGLTMTCLRREPWVPCVRPSLPSSPLSTELAQISTSLTLSEASRATPMKTSAVRPYSRKQQLLAAALHHSGGEGPARPTSKPAAGPSGKAHAGRPAETGLVESAATPDLPPVPVVLSSPLNEEGAVRLQGVGRGSGLSQGPASLEVSHGGVPSRLYVSDNGGPSLFFSSQVGMGCDTAGGRSREGGKGFPHAVPSALMGPKHTLAVCLASSNFTFADDGRDANADDGFARDAGALRLTYHGNPDEGGVAPVESLCCVHINRGAASEWHFTTEREGAREVDRYTGVVTRTFLSGNQQILFPDGGIVNRYREVSQAPAFNNEHFDSISFDQSHSRIGSHSYSESQMSSPHPASLKGEDGAEKTEPQEKRYTTYCETLITASGRCYVRTVHDLTLFEAEPILHQTKRHDADPSQDRSLAQQFVLLPRRLGSKRSYDSGHECVVVSREDGVCSAWYAHTDQPSRTTPTPATVGDVMEKRVGGFDRDSPGNLSARAYARVVLHTDGTSITTLNVSRRVPVASMSKWLEQNMVLAPLGREITHVENLCADLPRSAPDDTMQIPAMRVRFCIESTRMPRIFLVLPDSVAVGISSVRPRAAYYAIFHDGSILLRRRCRPLGGGEREKDKESEGREEGGYHGETLLTRAGMTSFRVLHDEAIVRVEPAAAVAAVEGRPHAIAVGEGFPTFDLAHGGLHIVDSCQQITEVTRLFSRETEPRVGVRPSTWKELLRALVTERFSPHRVPRRKQQEMNQRQLDREAAGEEEGNSSKDVERQRGVPFYASFGIRRQRLVQEYVIQQELLRSDVLAQHLERERRARTGEGRPPGVLPLFFSQRGGGGKEGKGEEVVAFLPDGALAAGMRAARATSGAAILATAGEWRSPWGLGNPHPSFLIAARSALGGEPDLQQISLTLVKSSSDGGGDSFLPERGGPEVEPSPEDGFLLFTDALKRQVRLSKFLCGFSVEAVLGGYPSTDNGAKLTMKRENTSTASSPTNNHTLYEKEALLTSLWGRQLCGGVGRWLPPSMQPCRLPTCGPNSAPTNADGENIMPRQHAQKLLRSFICFKKLPNPEKVIMDEVRRQDTLNKMKAITKPVT